MRISIPAVLFPILVAVLACGQDQPPANLSSKTTIAQKTEPGQRLVLTTTVYDRDGKTPLPNITVYAYHTDATGVYAKPVNDSRRPRLRGWVKTDTQGRFELDTIKPEAYPEGGNPAHIHVVLTAKGVEVAHDECWFEGDRFLSESLKQREQAAGKFSRIVRLTKGADGVWRGEWNLRVR